MSEPRILNKLAPTIFPLGFGIGQADDGSILMIEFYDNNRGDSGDLTVIGSFALTAKKATDLAKAILDQTSKQQDE